MASLQSRKADRGLREFAVNQWKQARGNADERFGPPVEDATKGTQSSCCASFQCGVVRAFVNAMMLNKTAARTRVSFVCDA